MEMKTILFFLLSISTLPALRQKIALPIQNRSLSINWADTKEWRLYYIHSKRGFAFPMDTLKNFKSLSLNEDSMKTFLQTVTKIPVERTPVWMGYYVSSCRLPDGTLIKIEISQYGRFFYEERGKIYYQLTDQMQGDWLSYLTAKWKSLEGVSE